VSSPSTYIDETDLHALVDGELDPDHRRRVEDHLLLNPDDATLVESWRRQNAALRAAFEPIALETPPLSLRTAATRAATQTQAPIETGATHWGRPGATPRPRRIEDLRVRQRRQAVLISALLLVSGLALAGLAAFVFTSGRGAAPPPLATAVFTQGYVSRAGLTYATYTVDAHPVEFDASRREELADRLKTRVGFSRIPDLSTLNFHLLGGRIVPGASGPAGFLIYERADGGRIGLYFERAIFAVAPPAPKGGFGVTAIEWRAADFAFVLVGPLQSDAMQAAAERAAAQVTAPAP
jgi:anti-sigma factor RsiW